MQPKQRQVEKLVRVLRDPEPRFVSLVDHGANQTPFVAVKNANGKGVSHMALRTKTSKKDSTASKAAAVLRISFPTEGFSDEAAVKAWLKKFEWDESTLVLAKSDDGFVATSKNLKAEDFEGNLRKVEGEGGAVAEVGVLKASEEDAAEGDEDNQPGDTTDTGEEGDKQPETTDVSDKDQHEAPLLLGALMSAKTVAVKGDKEAVKKFDWWASYLSGETSVAEVLKDGMSDGLPPGFQEVMYATQKAIANVLKAGDEKGKDKKIKNIANELAQMTIALDDMFDQIKESKADNISAEAKAAAAKWFEEREAAAKAGDELPPPPATETAEQKAAREAEEAQKAEEAAKAALQTSANPAPPAQDQAVVIATAVASALGTALEKAMEPINKSIASIHGKLGDLEKGQKAAAETATKALKTAETVASAAPTKKAQTPDPVAAPADPAKTTTAKQDQKLQRDLIGIG